MNVNRPATALLALAVLSAGYAYRCAGPETASVGNKGCKGYTIIEYGKGMDCLGDTVELDKVGGLQVLALQH